jgi:tetratricopeptide (TPR) repeat protein
MGAGLFTAWVERKFIGAQGSEYNFTIIERFLIAGRAFWFYLGKLLWPVDLVFIYPRWQVSQTVGWQYLFPAAMLLLLAGLWWVRRWRGPLAGLLFFAVTLFPALGFFNVYPFRYSLVADHFQYLAGIGPIVLVAAGISTGFNSFSKSRSFLEPVLCGTLLAVLGVLTWRQCQTYQSAETLWRTTIARNPGDYWAYNALGVVLAQNGLMDEAIPCFKKALEKFPNFIEAHNNLGNAFLQKGQVDEALEHFKQAVEIDPGSAILHYNFGDVLLKAGQMDEAIGQYKKALEIRPGFAAAHYNLGVVLAQKGRVDEAIAQFKEALRFRPDDPNVKEWLRELGVPVPE